VTHDEDLPLLPTSSVCFELVDDADGRRLGVEIQNSGDVCAVWDCGTTEAFSLGRVDSLGQNDWDYNVDSPMRGVIIAAPFGLGFWALLIWGLV
jgi:hypothetical protein